MSLIDEDYDVFTRVILMRTGVDLNKYKRPQMQRRLLSLCRKNGFSDFRAYAVALEHQPSLLSELLDRMTINVSEFYRNTSRWAIVGERVLPHLLRTRSSIRAWSAACASGEEAYSLAFTMLRILPLESFEITGTDIDDRVLKQASIGRYAKRDLETLPEEDRQQYFLDDGPEHAKVSDRVRNRMTFRKQNLLLDNPNLRYDFILCRNVLIYFTEEAKRGVIRTLAHALTQGGILFVGSTEQIFGAEEYGLVPFDTFFYEKIS